MNDNLTELTAQVLASKHWLPPLILHLPLPFSVTDKESVPLSDSSGPMKQHRANGQTVEVGEDGGN